MPSLSLPQLRPAHPSGRAVQAQPSEQARDLTGRTYLSFSQVNGFRRCPRAWAYHYVEDATPAFTPQALIFGSAFHFALQSDKTFPLELLHQRSLAAQRFATDAAALGDAL